MLKEPFILANDASTYLYFSLTARLVEGSSIQFNLKGNSATDESLRPPMVQLGITPTGDSAGYFILRLRVSSQDGAFVFQANKECYFHEDNGFTTFNIAVGNYYDEAQEQDQVFSVSNRC